MIDTSHEALDTSHVSTSNKMRDTSHEKNHEWQGPPNVIARESTTAAISSPTEESEEEKRKQYEALKERMTKAS